MKRSWLVIVVLALAASYTWLHAQDANRATVSVRVPDDARVYFDGTLMQQTGTVRSFVTPTLPDSDAYLYEVKAEVDRQGQVVTQTQKVSVRAGRTTTVDFSTLGADPAANAGDPSEEPAPAGDNGWPRKFTAGDTTLTIYQPQLESWEGNRLTARAAASVEKKSTARPVYGVFWLSARTEVDKETRLVTLEDLQLTKANFPATDAGQDYLALFRQNLPDKTRTISLDRLQANLAVTRAEAQPPKAPLKNDPPRILYSSTPAILVLVDGQPALRQIPSNKLLRVINTRALLLLDEANGKNYLHVMDRWVSAATLDGPWAEVETPPAELEAAKQAVVAADMVDLLDDPAPDLKDELENGKLPTVYVSTVPAELIDTRGEPEMAPIDGTQLLWVKNTSDQVILDLKSQEYYVLLSGRWFRSKSLAKGPWDFVPGDKLPPDVAKIPDTHPKGDVLASVAGTPQSKEAVIANEIPQTATIKRSEAKLTPTYDGDPQFQPIEDTPLQYAVNSPTPVIRVQPDQYYAAENGVWFTAAAPAGPWAAATVVPPVIYTIPPNSPLNYVTNVYVYGSTPDLVYCGYTPGYYGTCYAPYGCVVYGTGWPYRPWLGRYWYGRPWSYGYAAGFRWTPAGGWGFGFAAGVGRPWWGPVGWHAGWSGGAWNAGWRNGWGGAYANLHSTHVNVNNFNSYNRWGNNVRVNNVRNVQVRAVRTTNVNAVRAINVNASQMNIIRSNTATQRQLNNVYAGRDGNVYRRANEGWQSQAAGAWQSERRAGFEATNRSLNGDWAARRAGEVSHSSFRAAGGNAGFNAGGFRAGGGGFRGGRR